METQNLQAAHEEKGQKEDFAEELPPALQDAARRGLAWLEPDGLTGPQKLNLAGSAWLARFFPPGMRGSRLPESLRRCLSRGSRPFCAQVLRVRGGPTRRAADWSCVRSPIPSSGAFCYVGSAAVLCSTTGVSWLTRRERECSSG